MSRPHKNIHMVLETLKRDDLLQCFRSLIQELKYSSSYKERLYCGVRHLHRFMVSLNEGVYTPTIGSRFLCTIQDNPISVTPGIMREREKVVFILNSHVMCQDWAIRPKRIADYSLRGDAGEKARAFIKKAACDRQWAPGTILLFERVLSRFTEYLRLNNISLSRIRRQDIVDFLSTKPNNVHTNVYALRSFVKHLFENNIISNPYTSVFSTMKASEPEIKVLSYYSTEEVRTMEMSVSRSSVKGKRDYAMILLASRLGLRASDIISLSLSNIDWDNNLIQLVQQKTQKSIRLPLLPEVGEAIIDYIMNGRPNHSSNTLFLTLRDPFRPLCQNQFSQIVGKYMQKSGVNIAGRHHGVHCLRHSVAGALLKNEVPLPVISQSLGHSSTASTMIYLNIDIDALMKCSLNVPTVSDDFYNQNGGALYG